tara:strand:+ start:301 stop:978 length:678 start_codon:yes stop_codon:yes gene_type:complete
MARRKNTKRIDPRYFMGEKAEVLKESLVDDIIQIINDSPYNLDDTELAYEIKEKFPQSTPDQIYKAMNDEKLDPYYDSINSVYSKINEEGQTVAEGDCGEGSMARSQLGRTAELALMIQQMIDDDSDLEEWVESKITKSQDYLSSVLNYMRGEQLSENEEDEKEILVRDERGLSVARMTLRQIKDNLQERLAEAAMEAKEQGTYTHLNSGMIQALYRTLKDFYKL